METVRSTEPQQRDALAEGRRIYLGNLLYSVKPADVEDLLRQSGFDQSFEKLHISIDPVSGRNPGYCFAEFATRDEADRALDSLPGVLLFNRPVKVGPCNPKTPAQSRWGSKRSDDYNPTFQRWGDWKGQAEDSNAEQGPHGAIRHLEERSRRNPDKASLYIGGLGKMINQEHHDTEMQEILAGFD
jgi:RNA recognition motif-containing protein